MMSGVSLRQKNLETWRRLSRLELLELIRELADAAMATLDVWPTTGEGRQLKQACEQASSVLNFTIGSKLAKGMREIESVVNTLRQATESDYFVQTIAPRKLKSGRWKGQGLGSVVDNILGKTAAYIATNRPDSTSSPKPSIIGERAFSSNGEQLAKITPPQQIGPLQFEFSEGVLRIKRQVSSSDNRDHIAAESARIQLVRDADWLIENLSYSNVDQRAVSIVEDMRLNLANADNVIQTGIVNLACNSLATKLADEIAASISAKWQAFSVGVSIYVSQFSEWHRFVDNASDIELISGDTYRTYDVAKRLIADLKGTKGLADPEVPQSIELLLEAMSSPGRAGKRALFAMIRTIENLVAKM